MRGLPASPRLRIVLGAVALWCLWQAWLSIAAGGKVADGFATDRPKVDVLVTLRFAPERFHVLVFQQHGRVSGTMDDTIEVRGVKPADLTALARPYWVKRVAPLPKEGT